MEIFVITGLGILVIALITVSGQAIRTTMIIPLKAVSFQISAVSVAEADGR